MEELSLDNLVLRQALRQAPASLSFLDTGVSITTTGNSTFIERKDLKNFSVFLGRKEYCLRIISEEGVYDFQKVHESAIKSIRNVVAHHFGMQVPQVELERLDTTRGNLTYTNSIVTLHSQKEVFSFPKSSIKQVVELGNDLEIRLDDVEIVFTTTSDISQFISSKMADEVCILTNVSCINPRSRSTLVFFSDYFVLKGSSYDHSLFYTNIEEIFLLSRDEQSYLVVKLSNCIMQGQTKYESLVFVLNDRHVEVAAKGDKLRSYYSGSIVDVLPDILSSLTKLQVQESNMSFRCTSKVHEGYLYFLEGSLQFLPKSISIPLHEISYVEFSRINLSIAQAKTFDMTVIASKLYPFSGIQKSAFGEMEAYFNRNGIKIVSEVIDEDVSSDSTQDDDDVSDLSGIVDDGNEE